MKALSLWQPWATLVAVGAKQIETRHWLTRHRGPILIHAAKHSITTDMREWFRTCPHFQDVCRSRGQSAHLGRWQEFARGAVVAYAVLKEIRVTQDCTWISEQERAFGNFEPGRYGWVLHDVRPLQAPFPLTGRQGLFDVHDPPLREILYRAGMRGKELESAVLG